jgi:hypothetical protein
MFEPRGVMVQLRATWLTRSRSAAQFNRAMPRRGETMRSMTGVFAALALTMPLRTALAADHQRFDGSWLTTVSCAAARDALGYSYQFVSTVKDGTLHGLHGTAGEPSSLKIDGTIGPDGTGRLYAIGRVGSREVVPGRETPRGTEYSYDIDAHFSWTTGSGTRIEGRPCTLRFEKQ